MNARGPKGAQGPDGKDGPRGDQGRRGQAGRDGSDAAADSAGHEANRLGIAAQGVTIAAQDKAIKSARIGEYVRYGVLLVGVVLALVLVVAQIRHNRDYAHNVVQQRLEQVAAGSCYRQNYRGWQDDLKRYSDWRRDVQGSLHAVPPLRPSFRAAVANDYFVPLTDCKAALQHPLTYVQPRAVRFDQVSPAVLAMTLSHPPQPPGFSPGGY